MTLPDPVRAEVEAALEGVLGRPTGITDARPVGGGCINPSARITTEGGPDFFVKWNEKAAPGLFEAEADGLRALAAPGSLRVPEVIDVAPSWLLLEHIRGGAPGRDHAHRLGEGLADLHRRGAAAALERGVPSAGDESGWGWGADNWIGSLPQANEPAPGWAAFWRDRRIVPQLRRARERGFLADATELDDLVERMGPALEPAEEDGPSLLHGDLWGGNLMTGADGEPVLVDPAVYRGHREVDLAMSELFGGFPSGFFDAYEEAWPLVEGYRRARRPLYQLYYLLVHVNLFGSGYVGRTLQAARDALAAAG